jgi:hypothetical protein
VSWALHRVDLALACHCSMGEIETVSRQHPKPTAKPNASSRPRSENDGRTPKPTPLQPRANPEKRICGSQEDADVRFKLPARCGPAAISKAGCAGVVC